MKLKHIVPVLIAVFAVAVTLSATSGLTRAAPDSGVVTICDDAHFATALSGGGTVTFDCGGPTMLTVTSIKTISANTTIDGSNNGNPLTLTANSGVRLFSINSSVTLTMANLTIANLNYATYPIYNQGTLVISNTTLVSNTAGLIDNLATLNIINSTLNANTVTALYGLVINNETGATLNIISSTLNANTAAGAYGDIINNGSKGTVNIVSSTLSANTSPSGYIIYNSANATATLTSSTLISNTAYKVIYALGNLTVTNSSFITNTATYYEIIYSNSPASIVISGSQFINNAGTGISNNGPLTVTNSTFTQHAAGWAIASYGATSIDNSNFISNTSGVLYSTNRLLISNSRFYWNRGGGYASVIYLYGYGYAPALTLTNSSLMSNTAPGGAIYNYYGGTAYISNTQFVSNTSTNSWGALYLDNPGAVQVLSSTFQINTGGCIGTNSASNPLSIADSQFISNTSQFSAGAINAGTITITHSSFIGNVSAGGSGALDARRQAYVADSTFLNNTGYWGGAMQLTSGGFGPFYDTVTNSIIKGNTSTSQGGGGIRANQYLTLVDSEVSDNTAKGNAYGGGLYFANGYTLTVTNVLFQNNVVTGTSGLGGGVYFVGSGGLITGSTIVSNSAGSGGGVYQNSGPLQIASTSVQSNTAQTFFGGGLESHDAMTLRDVNVIGNRNVGTGGQGFGGGLYVASFANPLQVSRSLFYNNVASNGNSQGGGIYLTSPALITNTTIYSNSAGNGGNGLNYNTSYVITLTNLTILSNTTAGGIITSQLSNTGTAYRVALVNTLIGGGCTGNKVLSLGHNLSSDASCTITTTGDLSSTNPLLGAFADNGGATYHFMPQANSPAVNAGDNNLCPGDDQRGINRPIGAACDIGSLESPHLTPQTITFNPLADHFVNDAPFTITATASSNLSVAFNYSGVCSVSGSTVTLSGVIGTCSITATQAGDATYAPATAVARSFNIAAQLSQTITFDPIPDHFVADAPFLITAMASSGLSVTVTSLTTSVCTISNNLVTLLTAGTCTLRASQAGDATYTAAPNIDRSFTVKPVYRLYLPVILR